MPDLFDLPAKCRRGSKPRCHLLTHGPDAEVAARLTELIAPWGEVSAEDEWMPRGFVDLEEAQLHKAPRLLPDECVRKALQDWWMAVAATTPNWDIASTCTIEGKTGLLLIEAKAHDEELIGEEVGKRLDDNASCDSRKNHAHIDGAITEANVSLNAAVTGWNLSHESCYQMSNRFAWSWKLTQLGFPVILVYLGFTYAVEMHDRGTPFVDHSEWQQLVKSHSARLVPSNIWDHRCEVNGLAFIPLIRSL